MADEAFLAEVGAKGGADLVTLSGIIDRSAQTGMEAAYAEAQSGGPVVLDFTNVTFISSTGIALIVGLLAKARAAGRPVRAYGLTPHYQEIFRITRLADFIDLFDSQETAVAAS